jgi:hypothetical protein
MLLDAMAGWANGQRVYVAGVNGASPALVRALKLKQRRLTHLFAGLIAAAVPEASGHTELAMPAAMSLMGMACWHVLWFREMAALSRREYARLVTAMVVAGVREAAAAGVGGWEDAPAPSPGAPSPGSPEGEPTSPGGRGGAGSRGASTSPLGRGRRAKRGG